MIRRWGRRRRDLVCRDAVALMSDYVDGGLEPEDRARLEQHLASCPHCTEYLAQLRATIDALGRAEPDDLSDDAVDELVRLYRQWRTG
ncbi:MAG TPA: zf-HC2 domain-containing protein [Acidimicrobiales bacterium]|nr:zf-HC2 domain-containing protein [Acidimicrobiales bacterium]